MKRDALTVILLGTLVLLLAALAPPGGAAAQPKPTMTISPASGPCDATVEVAGTGFSVLPPTESLGLYLLRPGTNDVSMMVLNAASVQRDGTFSQLVPLSEHGCEAAALDSKAEPPTGKLFIAASPGESPAGVGEGIPDIITVAQYAYTTTAAQVHAETMSVSPQSGPCDATVDLMGQGFEPGAQVPLDLARPNSDDVMGRLAIPTADSEGKFAARVSLGHLGCDAAALVTQYGSADSPGQIEIYAGLRQDVLFVAARARYAYTTTAVSTAPQALPSTGSGPGDPPPPLVWFALAGALAAAGLVLVGGSLYRSRRLRG